jgi:von Willebrand factor type A domain
MRVVPRNSFLVLGVLLLGLGVVWPATPRASAPALQKGGNKTVFAVALDADMKPVPDLTKEELGIREDGIDRTVVDVKRATDPLDIVLMIDTSKSIQTSITELRTALTSFAHGILKDSPGASISVMTVAGAAVMVADSKKTVDDLDKTLTKTIADQTATTVFLEGMVDAAKKLAKSPSPRRAIVVVNLEGIPESSSVGPQQVVQQILASGASLWAASYNNAASRLLSIQPGSGAGAAAGDSKGGGIGSGNSGQNRDTILTRVPAGTGGTRLTVEVPTALQGALDQIAAALVGQYAVTYTRPDGPMPKQLQMGQTRNGIKIIYPSTPPK